MAVGYARPAVRSHVEENFGWRYGICCRPSRGEERTGRGVAAIESVCRRIRSPRKVAHLARDPGKTGDRAMTRLQLEHLIRAAADIADDDDIIVIGSQAILGQFPNAPEAMRVSAEADLYPLHHPERANLIEGSIG